MRAEKNLGRTPRVRTVEIFSLNRLGGGRNKTVAVVHQKSVAPLIHAAPAILHRVKISIAELALALPAASSSRQISSSGGLMGADTSPRAWSIEPEQSSGDARRVQADLYL